MQARRGYGVGTPEQAGLGMRESVGPSPNRHNDTRFGCIATLKRDGIRISNSFSLRGRALCAHALLHVHPGACEGVVRPITHLYDPFVTLFNLVLDFVSRFVAIYLRRSKTVGRSFFNRLSRFSCNGQRDVQQGLMRGHRPSRPAREALSVGSSWRPVRPP